MKIFSEEPPPGKKADEFILIIDSKEAVAIMEIAEAACGTSPKKATWKKIKNALAERLCCY